MIGLGWDARATDGADFDPDASAFLLAANDKVRGETDFIFCNQTRSPEGSVEHTGDNRTGAGMVMMKQLKLIWLKFLLSAEDCHHVTIHDAESRGQNFGQVQNAFIHVVNDQTNVNCPF